MANLRKQADMSKATCCEPGCERPVRCTSRCTRHYNRWLRITPKALRPQPTLRERILAKVKVDENGCWRWQGYVTPKGYGQVRGRSGTRLAYLAAYEEWVGPVPAGKTVDHLCRVRDCVNPEHLEPVPHRVNLLRGDTFTARNAAKTHCPAGHPYEGDNLIVKTDGRDGSLARSCRACRDRRNAQRYGGGRRESGVGSPEG